MASFTDRVKVIIDVATADSVKSIANFKKQFAEAEGAVNKFKVVGSNAAQALAANWKATAVGVGIALTKIGSDAVKLASDVGEAQSKVNVIFGQSAAAIEEFSQVAVDSFGVSRKAVLEAAGTFGIFGKAAGLSGKDLATFSNDFTGLAADLASFNNTTPEEAIQAIGAALRGENEPIRRYGILLNDATLKTEAMRQGIYNGNDALTAQQRILAATALIYQQSSDAQGDYARTSGGMANQSKTLAAQFENLKIALGEVLIPAVTAAVEKINELVSSFRTGGIGQFFSGVKAGAKFLYTPFQLATDAGEALNKELDYIGKTIKEDNFGKEAEEIEVFAEAMTQARKDADGFNRSMQNQEKLQQKWIKEFISNLTDAGTAILRADTAWQLFTGRLDTQVAIDNAEAALKDLQEAAVKAFGSGARADIDAYEAQFADLAGMAEAIAATMGDLSSKEFLIRFKIDPASAFEFARWVKSGGELAGLSNEDLLAQAGISTLPRRANGGPTQPGQTYLVGERGPELLTMGRSSGMVTPGVGRPSGNTYNITVNADALTDTASLGGKIVTAIKAYETRAGGGWRRG